MLLAQQPPGCNGSIPTLLSRPATHIPPIKLFNSLLSPAVAVCIEVGFTSEPNMAYWSNEPFDMEPRTSSHKQQPRGPAQNQVNSTALQSFRNPNAEVQEELKYDTGRCEDDLDMRLAPQDRNFTAKPTRQMTRSPDDDVDVFEVQHHSNENLSESLQVHRSGLANKAESLDLSPTNSTPPSIQLATHDPPHSTNTQAVTIKTRRLHSPILTPQRDPRTLFGSRETHLPWVTKLSPNRFTMTISPDTLSRDAPPPKSIWDADDDEFDRWPTASDAREELNALRLTATTKRSTFIRPSAPERSVADQIAEAVTTPMGDVTRSEQEQEQTILELEDMDCGNPCGRDLHDVILAPFRSHGYTVLPAHAPARYMHVLDASAYTATTDLVVKAARPRLCDAVATVLAYTSLECLAAFLDPEVEVFEWRRLIHCVLVRRVGREVMVGTYYNFGTTYQWGYLVRSRIDADGAWTETWATPSQGTTPVGKDGPLLDQFEAEGTEGEVEPDDEEFALYMGRRLADFLLEYEVWNYYKWWRYRVEWEADGKVTDAREKNRYPAGLTFD